MSLVNLIPPAQRRSSRGASSRPSTAYLEPLVPVVEAKKEPAATAPRPRSGSIRPLSSRVYLRRTVKKGWIAKGINEEEEDDELSNGGSLDSFFDDDFDDTPQSQVLEGFLSCNTLGVQTKEHKSDWIAGDVAIPKFHCPRCRDHWYGISAFPCDEELARLIREGKWYTGKEEKLTQQDSESKTRNRKTNSSNSVVTSHDSTQLPSIRKRRLSGFDIAKSDHKFDFSNPQAKTATKKNRRISFKIDGNDSELENSGSSGLLHDTRTGRKGHRDEAADERGANKGKLSIKASDGLSDTDRAVAGTIDSSSSASDINSSSSTTLLRGNMKGKINDDVKDNNLREKGKGSKRNVKTLGTKDEENGIVRNKTDNAETDSFKSRSGNNANIYSDDKSTGIYNQDANKMKELTTESKSHSSNGQHDKQNESLHKDESVTSSGNGTMKGNLRNEKMENGSVSEESEGRRNKRQSTGYGSRTSLNGGSQRWSEDGESNKRKERELVAGKGHMRASSPSQSDWGDPTHARAWASNTASSSRVSLTQSKDGGDKDIEEEIYLPPIKNRSKNPFASADLLDGFNFTRAFTFSYY